MSTDLPDARTSAGLSGFVSTTAAVDALARRRQIRILAMLGVAIWTIVAIALQNRILGLSDSVGLLLWVSGTALIVVLGESAHRSAARDLRSSVVVAADGQVVGQADRVGRAWTEHRAAPAVAGFSVYLAIGSIDTLVVGGDRLPLPVSLTALGLGIATWWYLSRRRQPLPR